LNRSFALLLKLEGSYSETESGYSDNKIGEVGVAAGVRWILNPGGFVEVSLYSVFGGSWVFGKSESKPNPPVNTSDTYGYDIGLGVGFAVEKKLLDNLYLRFETLVGRFGYQYDKQTVSTTLIDLVTNEPVIDKTHDHDKSIYALLAFSPAIELRMAF
jgi:hypothetical protein